MEHGILVAFDQYLCKWIINRRTSRDLSFSFNTYMSNKMFLIWNLSKKDVDHKQFVGWGEKTYIPFICFESLFFLKSTS